MMRAKSRGTSMAVDASHAARHDDKTFSVEVLSGGETATVIAAALTDYFDALDRAMEWLEREDPERTRSSNIGIFASSDGGRERVWAYPSEAGSSAEDTTRLVELFGFDPVAWKPPPGEFHAGRSLPPQREREPARPYEGLAAFAAAVEEAPPEIDSPLPSERLDSWLRSGKRLRLRQDFLAVWDDQRSRWCLVLGVICLWLTVTLSEPSFLAPLLAAAAGLWSRRNHRAAIGAEGVDDWF
jgi:hypothetical protein